MPNLTTSQCPMVFLDTETCGLDLDDPIWEIGLIRREPGSTVETIHHFFVEHDTTRAAKLPDRYRADHATRYDPAAAYPAGELRTLLTYLLRPSDDGHHAHIVGACPWFDTARISHQILDGIEPWHFHLVDVEAMALGRLNATGIRPAYPWSSDELFELLGIEIDRSVRHTAVYDALIAKAAYDDINLHPRASLIDRAA